MDAVSTAKRCESCNPSTGRFISQYTYTGNPYDPWTQHLYSYCGNNPTSMVDPTGHVFNLIAAAIGAVVGAAVGVVANGIRNVTQGKKFFKNGGAAAVGGAITGLAAGLTCGASLVVTAAACGIGSMAASVVTQAMTAKKVNPTKVAVDGVMGAATAALMGGLSKLSGGSSAGKPLYNDKGSPSPGKAVGQSEPTKAEPVIHSSGAQHGDATHYSQIKDTVAEMKISYEYTDIYINKGIRNVVPNASKNYRPDIMGVRSNGLIDAFEVQSPSQTIKFMQRKVDMLDNVLGEKAGIVDFFRRLVE